MLEGFTQRREKYRDNLEAFEFFAGGEGGLGITECPDVETLKHMMAGARA